MKQLLLPVIAAAILFASCGKGETASPSIFGGMWVEKTSKTDTIYFDPAWNTGETRGFVLKRGREFRNGLYVPKIGSGIYNYTITGDKMTLHYLILSCICPREVSYTRTRNQIIVENFYDPGGKGVIQTFEKIK